MRVVERQRIIAPAWSALLALIVLAPLLQPGYLLFRDAVSTPRSYLTDSALGLGDAAPRAVPQDWLLAGVSVIIDGGLAVTVILVLSVWLAGCGAALLARTFLREHGAGPGAECTAATVAIWNPFVAERLLQGHWSLLAGYAVLPWIVVAMHRIKNAHAGGWPMLVFAVGCAALTPTGAVLAIMLALGINARDTLRHLKRSGLILVIGAAAGAPWVVAALLSGDPGVSGRAGTEAFAARAEPWLGTLGSLAGLGGIWNGDAVPVSRTTPVALLATAWLLILVAGGAWALRRLRIAGALPLGLIALTSITIPAFAATPAGLTALTWVTSSVPGGGLLRDTQKFVALAMPFYALCAAAAVLLLAPHARALTRAVPAFACVMVIGVLPDLAWGAGGQLRTVQYPPGWEAAARIVEDGSPHGAVAVLPAGMFRVYPFTGDVVVLDPAPRMMPRDVLLSGDLVVAGTLVEGEGGRGRAAEAALLRGASSAELLDLGIEWVLVQLDTPGDRGDSRETLDQLVLEHSGIDVALYRVPGEPADFSAPSAARTAVAVAHALWLAVTLAAGVMLAVGRLRSTRSTKM